ncbi:hypothetical protein CRE_25867 [Caenorhabditis remanei]|uniref:Uncharacterized protein n=1 Tax=Caenorhabditis remanei TaxID=31234 RepID=E3NDQ4_CAERE|nr:hypothetical protein CRE_25867 [Caenorhabditis remanei]
MIWEKLIESFETMEKSGIVEEVFCEPENGYYIPYQQVFNAGSNTTKVGTIFDASSKSSGERSLNNALHQGPSRLPELKEFL